MTTPTAPAAVLKAVLRREALARRKAVHAVRQAEASAALARRIIVDLSIRGKMIAGYWPLGTELDCQPALVALKAAGADVALPVVAGQGQVLIFRNWVPGDNLEQGPFGTMHPAVRAPIVTPDILLLPLMAFDGTGHRLGYGAGYYDRTVAALRRHGDVVTVGIAYDEQQIDALPVDGHDQRMDAVMTDQRTLWFNPDVKP
jgi:5-formyltetrahydrofolate cyclo-ligase